MQVVPNGVKGRTDGWLIDCTSWLVRDYLPGNRDGIGKGSDWKDEQAEIPGPQQT